MQKQLYIFNPENDLALASGTKNYTAPAHASQLRSDLQLLPLWYANYPCHILAKCNKEYLQYIEMIRHKLPRIGTVDIGNVSNGNYHVQPWGWSAAILSELIRMGIKCPLSFDDAKYLRDISHRRISIYVFQWLKRNYPNIPLPETPCLCHTFSEIEEASQHFKDMIAKVPWSGSGRGICRMKNENLPIYKIWAEGILKKQGALICEKYLDKLQDFAMEYYVEKGRARFAGFSIFYNTPQMSYDHAIVTTSEKLGHILKTKYFMQAGIEIDTVKKAMSECLISFLPSEYVGYVGVDMMAYRTNDNQIAINPCIEVNLRATMGVVSAALGDRVVHPDKIGTMSILYHPTETDLIAAKSKWKEAVFKDGFLYEGTLSLVPITDNTRYTATLAVAE